MDSFVSVIVPCRNEREYIEKFLQSMILQDYPKDHLEILIADGASDDGTRQIIAEYQKQYPYIQLLNNPKKYTPFGLNLAIGVAQGEVIVRVDSHAVFPKDYLSRCLQHLKESGADNVGGIIKTVPANDTLSAKAVALVMGNGLGVGNSFFRKGSVVPREVDTVFGGCYKREVFTKVGLFNEKLVRSQDLEFNLRLKKAGGKIMLFPDIVSYYYPKATFTEFWKHNIADGQWAILPLKFTKTIFKLRHYLPLIFIVAIILLLGLSFFSEKVLAIFLGLCTIYLLLIFSSSATIAQKEGNPALFFSLPIAFLIRNFGYAVGSLIGVIKLGLWKTES